MTEIWPCSEIKEGEGPRVTLKTGGSSERKHFWLSSLGDVVEEVLFSSGGCQCAEGW